jgi:hypothetical protein
VPVPVLVRVLTLVDYLQLITTILCNYNVGTGMSCTTRAVVSYIYNLLSCQGTRIAFNEYLQLVAINCKRVQSFHNFNGLQPVANHSITWLRAVAIG